MRRLIEETPILSYKGYTILSTRLGYIVKGTSIRVVCTTLRRACIELAEHIARSNVEQDDDILSMLSKVEETYTKIESKLNETITKCYFPTADWNKELTEIDKQWP